MYNSSNLLKPSGFSSGAAASKNEIVIVDTEDILVYPPSDAGGVKLIGQFVLKAGASMYTMYSTKSKTEAPYESDGDEDAISIMPKFNAQHPGNRLEVKEFVQNWLGRNVIILHKACGDDFYEVMGTPCAPLQLKPSKTDNNDGRFHMLNFESYAKSPFVPKHYEGSVVFAEPATIADVTATEVPEGVSHLKVPALATTAAISFDVVELTHGQKLTLIGEGGADPATLSNGTAGVVTVMLVNGSQWVALRDATITFEVFEDGTNKYLRETARL